MGGMQDVQLSELTYDECLELLREYSVGRIAVTPNEFPVVLPVNYRLMEHLGLTWVALRTHPGSAIEQATKAAFEIDEIDMVHHHGWSVLVRGTLHHVDPDSAEFRERFDAAPWPVGDHAAWMVIQPFFISGRRLNDIEAVWELTPEGYL